MPVIIFEDKEQEYMQWINANPTGYVLTTVRTISPNYMSLHRASCRMISQYVSNMAKNAFTGRKYIKICSLRPSELSAWIKKNGGSGFTTLCSKCQPDTSEPLVDQARQIQVEFESAVKNSIHSNPEERKRRLDQAPRKPEVVTTTTVIFRRNPDVVAEVLYRAQGKCEDCKHEAPFNRASDGTPYLEVHHIDPLSEGGDDWVENAIALCPNCHRRAHYG